MIVSASLKGKHMLYLHFIGEETEAQRSDDPKALQMPGVPVSHFGSGLFGNNVEDGSSC